MKAKALLKLPYRGDKVIKQSIYNSIAVINTGLKHDSGFALMALIGLDENYKPIEIIGFCNDIKWELNGLSFSNDMLYPSGATHFWSLDANFEVAYCTSTTLINLVATNKRQYLQESNI